MAQDWGQNYNSGYSSTVPSGTAVPGAFYGSGGAYTPITTPDINSFDPNTDPVYLTYLRSLGLNQGQQKEQIARQTQYLNDSLAAQRPVWADQRAAAIAGIRDSSSARGVFNSSQRPFQETKANTAIDRNIASAERSNAYQIGNLNSSYKNNLAQNQLARENAAIQSKQRQAGNALQTSIANAQYNSANQGYTGGYGAVDQNYGTYQPF